MVEGPMREIKIPVQELRLKMLGGLIRKVGAYMRNTMVCPSVHQSN